MVALETIQFLATSPAAELSNIDITAKVEEAAKSRPRWHIHRGVDGYERFLEDTQSIGRTIGCSLIWQLSIPAESDIQAAYPSAAPDEALAKKA